MENIDQLDFDTIISVVRSSRGIDFSNYAVSSLRRRFLRFMAMNNLSDTGELAWKLRYDNGYADYFIKEVMVNVTEMFRDPSFWAMLREKIIPVIMKNPVIRIWHAACSTGEEVLSMAILLKELGVLHKSRIIATDINPIVLKVAAEGKYPLKHQELNQRNYKASGGTSSLSDYYVTQDHRVAFDEELLSKVSFLQHDLSHERAFSKFDLIICRNVMIYFNFTLQERVVDVFRESLDAGAFLGIGSKESIEWCKSIRYFELVSPEEKIFRRL